MSYVEIAGIRVPVYNGDAVWLSQTRLVLTPTTQSNLQKILPPLLHGDNLLLIGDAGVGKNALIYYINSLRAFPTIRYSFNADTLPEDLVGAYRMDPATQAFIWSDGPLARALRKGATFVADEMNLTAAEVLKRFYSVFTDDYLQLLEGDSTTVAAAAGFNFVATQNPAEGFEGRKDLPREIRKYFTTIYMDPYDTEEQVAILKGLYAGLPEDLLCAIVQANQRIEALLMQSKLGAHALERYHFNLRNLKRLALRLCQPDAQWEKELSDIYLRPFRTTEDRRLIAVQLHASLKEWASDPKSLAFSTKSKHSGNADPRRDNIQIHADSQKRKIRVGRASLDFLGDARADFPQAVEAACSLFPPLLQTLPTLEAIARSIQQMENILLEAMADIEPEDYVRFFSCLLGRPLRVITLSRGMHTAEVLGSLRPRPLAATDVEKNKPEKETPPLVWIDGPLTAAVRSGDFILLRGLEAAGPELVEKFNMLLDDARALVLPPESGEPEPLGLQNTTRIFAIKFFRTQRTSPSISRAFRNRFSAIVLEPITEKDSLIELGAHFLGIDFQDEQYKELLEAMVNFHSLLREQAARRQIGSARLNPYEFGLTNLKRWCEYILIDAKNRASLQGSVCQSASLAYTNEISDPLERQRALGLLDQLMQGVELSGLCPTPTVDKKRMIRQSLYRPRVYWDQKKHWRKANTARYKPRLYGERLKKGIRVNTPETGGNRKEGPDAWYGSDTLGNKGQGEPGSGGGAWGYRTQELYEEFIRRRRNLWNYDIDISLAEFKSVFGPELQKIVIDFDRLLDPHIRLKRSYREWGSRVDLRRYLAYLTGEGDGRIFDKTTIRLESDRLKGVELLFALNKGRRIFNFEYSLATLVALMSMSMLLREHHLPFGVVGYSDLSNFKTDADIVWYKNIQEELDLKKEPELFSSLAHGWHGDTVEETLVLEKLAGCFGPGSRTRILVVLSDFRGFRAKASMEKERSSLELERLRQTADALQQRGIHILGVGLGPRALAEDVFKESLPVGGENFVNLPGLMATRVTELIHRYHTTQAVGS